jgi:hypothetical protein
MVSKKTSNSMGMGQNILLPYLGLYQTSSILAAIWAYKTRAKPRVLIGLPPVIHFRLGFSDFPIEKSPSRFSRPGDPHDVGKFPSFHPAAPKRSWTAIVVEVSWICRRSMRLGPGCRWMASWNSLCLWLTVRHGKSTHAIKNGKPSISIRAIELPWLCNK